MPSTIVWFLQVEQLYTETLYQLYTRKLYFIEFFQKTLKMNPKMALCHEATKKTSKQGTKLKILKCVRK